MRLDYQNDAGFRGRTRYRSVAGSYSKLVPARRQIVINRGPAARYYGPLRIKSAEFVLKLHTARSPKAAGRKFDFHALPAGTNPHLSVGRHGLVVNPNCLQPDRRIVADARAIWIEVDRSFNTGEPQLTIGRETSGWLDTSIHLARFQTIRGSVCQNGNGGGLAFSYGIQIAQCCGRKP